MKLIIRIILVAGLGFFISSMLPWWSLAILAFLVSFFIYGNNLANFLSGFIGGGLLWMAYAWKLEVGAAEILSQQITQLLRLPEPLYLIIITGVIGALIGGFGALSGNTARLMFVKKKKSGLYH